MLTTKLVCSVESKSLELTVKLCLVNGSTKLDPVKVLKLEICFGSQDIFFQESPRISVYQYLSNLSYSRTGMELVVIVTSQQQP